MVLLWLAGTLGATTAVFATVATVSNDLFDAGDPRNAKDEIRRPTPGFITTTTVAEQLPTTAATTEPPTTEAATTTEVTEPPTTEPAVTDPEPVDTVAPRVNTTVRTTAPGNIVVTTVPIVTAPPTTQPPPAPTEPPATTAPATVAPPSCTQPTPRAVGRNVIYYRPCTDGLRYSSAVPQAGWTAVATAKGPPSVTVTFSNGSTSLTCTLSADSDGVVNTTGDC